MTIVEAAGRRWRLGELTDAQLKKCYADLMRVAEGAPPDGTWDGRWWNAFCRVARELLDEHQPGVTVELIRETFRPTYAPAFIEELQRQFLRRQHRAGVGAARPVDNVQRRGSALLG